MQAYCLVAAYFMYSPVSALLFHVFNCRKLWDPDPQLPYDGKLSAQEAHKKLFLQKDYSLSCETPEYHRMYALAWFMVTFIAAGLPVLYYYVLNVHSAELMSGELKALRFFVRDYVPERQNWEVAECLKRFLLAGIAVFFTRGSLMQIAVSTLLVFTYLILLVLLKVS